MAGINPDPNYKHYNKEFRLGHNQGYTFYMLSVMHPYLIEKWVIELLIAGEKVWVLCLDLEKTL